MSATANLTDELQRAEELAYALKIACNRARRGQAEHVFIRRQDAEELTQLLFDSLRTAQQLRTQVIHEREARTIPHHDWRVGQAVTPVLRSHAFFGRVGVVRAVREDTLEIWPIGFPSMLRFTELAKHWQTA